jgi:myo-inositol-1(or 4)-monophosphatase
MRGSGATLNGASIRCSATTDLSLALVATGFGYDSQRRAVQAARVAKLLPRVRDIRRFGAAAADLCYAAAGRVDAYFEEWLGPWDMAAGELIAREAGCRTGGLDGGPATPSSLLVATPALFESMRDLVAEIDARL